MSLDGLAALCFSGGGLGAEPPELADLPDGRWLRIYRDADVLEACIRSLSAPRQAPRPPQAELFPEGENP